MSTHSFILAEQSKKAYDMDSRCNLLPDFPITDDLNDDRELENIAVWGNCLVCNVFLKENYRFEEYIRLYNKLFDNNETWISANEMKMLAYISGAIWEEFGGERKYRAEVCCDIIRFCSSYPTDNFRIIRFMDFWDMQEELEDQNLECYTEVIY